MAIGERIHFFRILRGMTQKYLGMTVGFPEKSADVRLAQYENGSRSPKADLTAALAEVLDVSPQALSVPDIDSYTGLMHTLFTLEDLYGLKVRELDGEICLTVDVRQNKDAAHLHEMLCSWREQAAKLDVNLNHMVYLLDTPHKAGAGRGARFTQLNHSTSSGIGVQECSAPFNRNRLALIAGQRNTMKECLDFIVKDCEIAEENLPETVSEANLGRATKGAATALKARVLLHVASPLYADRTVNTLACNQFDGDRAATYRAAREAAVKVINSGNYELLDCTGGLNTERANKWNKIIITNNKEQIWVHPFGNLSGAEWNQIPLQHGPNGYHNWSGITPTQDLVMAFEFEDGTLPQGMTKPGDYQLGNPYNGREPRFYATVGTDGNEWGRPRPADAAGLDPTPLGRLQCGYYEVTDGDSKISLDLPNGQKVEFTGMNGIDTRKGPIEDWNGSWTGYYERKLIDPTVDGQYYPQLVPWTYIRLAEMYLVAAEASVELNELDEAVKYLDALRGRIGIKDTKAALTARGQAFNQENMREFVRHERRVELAYEESRYYDVRRWMIAPETNSKELTGILVFARLKPGKTAYKPYIHNEETWDYHYYVQSLKFRENRRWDNKMYFAPISRDEMNRNPNLVQNPGME